MAEYLVGGVSLREMGLKYGINFRVIHRWVKGLERGKVPEGEVILPVRPILIADAEEMPVDVQGLQRELKEARLYNKILNAMIDIAEDEMGVPIRKKPGAGQ